jgi:thiamine-phosphate pyrophosphorylase
MRLRGLYAITPDIADRGRLMGLVQRAIEGGIGALQYRCKSLPSSQRLEEAARLAQWCRAGGATFIVNDDPGIAIAADADGAHLGRDDGDLATARARLGGKLLGASCYDALDAARMSVAAGADYVAFGSVFASPTKPAAVRAPLSLFAAAKPLGVPLVAIGGITLDNTPQLIEAGADSVAVISDLFDAPDVAARARAYGILFSR